MALRLLPKREIDKAKSQDRALEIGEGKKLAERVDNLRSLVAQEEKNLRNFKEKTVPAVLAEIKALSDRKEYLKADLEELENRRLTAKQPLDKEWLRIKEKQEELAELSTSFAAKETELAVLHEKHLSYGKELEVEKGRISDERARSTTALKEAIAAKEEGEQALREAKKTASELIQEALDTQGLVSKREHEVALIQKQVYQQHNQNKQDKIDLMNRERALQDKYETLERTLKRYGR